MTNKQVAYALTIDEQTVKNHMSSILRKLSVNDRTQAVVYAMRQGLDPHARGLMSTDPATRPASGVKGLSSRLADDLLTLDKELGEIDLLISQARTEAGRHESRRGGRRQAASLSEHADPRDRVEQSTALIALTQRAALMETQVEVLDGKRRALARYRDSLADYIQTLEGVDPAASGGRGADTDAPMDPATARLLMGAQEDLRREIARQMHDGPAQSLTNIVLQAQIVERLVRTDPERAATEVGQLVGMVQQTLDATKTFIFDVRPMVLDDLGLVPTLRRATRERGRRANVPVEFESMGQDRRLPMDLESGLFRMLDEGLAAYLAAEPDSVTRLDWSDRLVADMVATRGDARARTAPRDRDPQRGDPPHDAARPGCARRRTAGGPAGRRGGRRPGVCRDHAPADMARDPGQSGVGRVQAALLADGGRLYLVADLPMMDGAGAARRDGRPPRTGAGRVRADPRPDRGAHDGLACRLRRHRVGRPGGHRHRDRSRDGRLKPVPVHPSDRRYHRLSVSAETPPYSGAALDWG